MRDWKNVVRVVWVTIVNTAFCSLVAAIIPLNLNLPFKKIDDLQLLMAAIFITTCLCGIVLQLRKRQAAFVVNISIPGMLLIYVGFAWYFTPVPTKIAHAKLFLGECVTLTSSALVTVLVYALTRHRSFSMPSET